MRRLFFIFDLEIILALFAFIFCITFDEWSNLAFTKTADSVSYPRHKKIEGNIYRTHDFLDYRSKKHRLRYELLKKHVQETEQRYGYSKDKLYAFVNKAVQKYCEESGGKIKVKLDKDLGYRTWYSRKNEHLKQSIKTIIRDSCRHYYEAHMLILRNNYIGIDYKKIQQWQSKFVAPLYDALKSIAKRENMNERELIVLMARFVQYLEYKVPNEPPHKNILGFWPPIICLKEKAGDCDSKSTLFASIFYHFKKKSCVLINTRRDESTGHVFVGIKRQHKVFPKDKIVTIGGVDCLLLETTRPGWDPGQLSKKDWNAVKRGRFKYTAMY